ncbi:MAG: hypothetical protein OIF48_13375, partial [Silicimonas sp.]|nr:hypothetical protein [Silicimonas sp.]
NAVKGAYLNRNTVAALNRPIRTFEDLGVVRHLAGNLCSISVSYDQLRMHLSDGEHLNKSTFEMSVFHFYECHEERQWNEEMRGSGTRVCIKPKLQGRFRDAGLLDSNWEWHGWSETMAQSIAPISLDDWKLTPTVDEFFQQVY